MDARMWHNYCLLKAPEKPPPLTLKLAKSMSDEERAAYIDRLQRWLEHLYLLTPELEVICAAMTNVVRVNARKPPGTKDVIVLTGPNVIGKSSVMMRWGRDRYLEWTRFAPHDQYGYPIIQLSEDSEADLVPLAWMNLPADAVKGAFDREFLGCFGLSGQGRVDQLTHRAISAAARHQTRVLIVDDVHLLKTDWKGGRAVLDHLKHINTELGMIGATLILVGPNLVGGDIVCDPQIEGRLKLMKFPSYSKDNVDEMRRWQAVALQLEKKVLPYLPAGRRGMLFTQLAGELLYRTDGYLGDLAELVAAATLAAIEDGTNRILLRHLNGVRLSERAENIRRAPQTDGS
ncbi:TniB family NTP-binding protein [Mycolicibacterium porcinum]|uniref:TniB family NTP-binding protein n=1 Tax=Mycolicibacterium porcinum TaxID=39693 RepID=A0AAW5T8B5_9MYCO|nr:TniB family NTP-binding protein [Mycolicibacterium porcinum]MCV7390514.1 TniB family NTP-binding protein [Mycolicibacterium porcinum]ORB36117.1 hypothetical protein BST41_26175 [Mycolicibacterium porcinum]CDO31104.1 ATP/GTP-binding protein [Mycolicibacterium vulneris]